MGAFVCVHDAQSSVVAIKVVPDREVAALRGSEGCRILAQVLLCLNERVAQVSPLLRCDTLSSKERS